MESNDVIEIIHGLNKGDIVVISGDYLLDFKRGTNPMAGHGH